MYFNEMLTKIPIQSKKVYDIGIPNITSNALNFLVNKVMCYYCVYQYWCLLRNLMHHNVWCNKNCTKLSNVLLLRLVWFLMHQMLVGTLLTASEFFWSFSGVITKVQDSDRIAIGINSWIHLSWLSKHLLLNLTIFKK